MIIPYPTKKDNICKKQPRDYRGCEIKYLFHYCIKVGAGFYRTIGIDLRISVFNGVVLCQIGIQFGKVGFIKIFVAIAVFFGGNRKGFLIP